MGRKFTWQELAADADTVEPSIAAPVTLADDDVASKLAEMPAEGPGDGSLELLRVARRAIGLGVERDGFAAACVRWNGQRAEPWDEDDLLRRYDDARRRFDEEGLAAVPTGRYTRAALGRIVREDKRYAGRFEWDELEMLVLFGDVVLDDVELTHIEEDVCHRYGFPSIPREALRQSIVAEAHKRRRNRVIDYLEALPPWDGVSRDSTLVEALQLVEEHREIGGVYLRKMRIAACARAIEPGCKVDNMLILVGDEGYRKSTFFEVLAGPGNFADTKIDLENKDAYLQIHRAWIYEWSEVEAITRRADVARVKGFLSSKADTFRAPYERTVETHPRRGIIVGSSNSHDLVQDLDSNRRSWIVEVERTIDLEWVRANRDQLWAEALHAYGTGEAWYLLPEQEAARREVNALFEPDNPLVDRIETVVAEMMTKNENKTGLVSKDLFARLGLDPSVNKAAVSVVNSVLRRMGFRRGKVRKNGSRVRGYLPSKQPSLRVVETEAETPETGAETA